MTTVSLVNSILGNEASRRQKEKVESLDKVDYRL